MFGKSFYGTRIVFAGQTKLKNPVSGRLHLVCMKSALSGSRAKLDLPIRYKAVFIFSIKFVAYFPRYGNLHRGYK